ncbi:MAG: hypothetical protein C4K58_07010 [Flavobacteriaceae bacterium]|nr:MAG: hypothetical protein C4K58_07010 [Flavobacteriaceae bacterium]
MTKQFLILFLLFLSVSCKSSFQKVSLEQKDVLHKNEVNPIKNIRFDFSARRINVNHTILVNATLHNDNANAIYFLTESCSEEQNFLNFDKDKFILSSSIFCNMSFPRLIKIEPYSKYEFQTQFVGTNETKIKLGFDFYMADESVDISKMTLGDYLENKEYTTIWADEKFIE